MQEGMHLAGALSVLLRPVVRWPRRTHERPAWSAVQMQGSGACACSFAAAECAAGVCDCSPNVAHICSQNQPSVDPHLSVGPFMACWAVHALPAVTAAELTRTRYIARCQLMLATVAKTLAGSACISCMRHTAHAQRCCWWCHQWWAHAAVHMLETGCRCDQVTDLQL